MLRLHSAQCFKLCSSPELRNLEWDLKSCTLRTDIWHRISFLFGKLPARNLTPSANEGRRCVRGGTPKQAAFQLGLYAPWETSSATTAAATPVKLTYSYIHPQPTKPPRSTLSLVAVMPESITFLGKKSCNTLYFQNPN